jgi:four helix bundle protein
VSDGDRCWSGAFAGFPSWPRARSIQGPAAALRAVARGLATLEPTCARWRGAAVRWMRRAEGALMSLQIYPVILDLVRKLAPTARALRAQSPALSDQMERALVSIPLNVGEGSYSRGRNRSARFQTAAASAREALACLETAEAMGFAAAPSAEIFGAVSSRHWDALSPHARLLRRQPARVGRTKRPARPMRGTVQGARTRIMTRTERARATVRRRQVPRCLPPPVTRRESGRRVSHGPSGTARSGGRAGTFGS